MHVLTDLFDVPFRNGLVAVVDADLF